MKTLQTEDSGVPSYAKHHFRYYSQERKEYYGLFEVYAGEDGFYYWPCRFGCTAYDDSVGPFASVEDAVNDAREV